MRHWRTLELWLKAKAMGDTVRQVVQELGTIHSMDLLLTIRDRGQTRLRIVGKPEPLAADLLAHLGLKLPARPKIIENVVAKNPQQSMQVPQNQTSKLRNCRTWVKTLTLTPGKSGAKGTATAVLDGRSVPLTSRVEDGRVVVDFKERLTLSAGSKIEVVIG